MPSWRRRGGEWRSPSATCKLELCRWSSTLQGSGLAWGVGECVALLTRPEPRSQVRRQRAQGATHLRWSRGSAGESPRSSAAAFVQELRPGVAVGTGTDMKVCHVEDAPSVLVPFLVYNVALVCAVESFCQGNFKGPIGIFLWAVRPFKCLWMLPTLWKGSSHGVGT